MSKGQRFGNAVLFINGVGVTLVSSYLLPQGRLQIMTTVNVGHTIAMSVAYFDTKGNPMLVAPKPDLAPVWTNTTPATETVAASADGMTAVATPVAVGDDTVTVAVMVGGVAYSASLAVTVDAAPQVLGSVQIVASVN
jgi:hypothetical protein